MLDIIEIESLIKVSEEELRCLRGMRNTAIAAAFAKTKSLTKVAEEFGLCSATVSNIVKRHAKHSAIAKIPVGASSLFSSLPPTPSSPLFKKIDELYIDIDGLVDAFRLSKRSCNCLKNDNIVYIGDLIQKSEAEMLRIPNFGRESLNEIKVKLAQMGLHLGMEVPNWQNERPREKEKVHQIEDPQVEFMIDYVNNKLLAGAISPAVLLV